MEQLKELVYILSLNKTKKIRQYGFLQDESGRLLEFYKGMVEEKWNTDEEAAKALLGLDAKHKTYRRLKNKLQEELLNAFLFLDFDNSSHSDIQKVHHDCYKNWTQISILASLAAEYFDLMDEAEIVFANQSAEIEYIPYHFLWKYGMQVLDRVIPN